MLHELKIDSEFETIIKAMSDEEFKILEEEIIEDGEISDPITVWNGVIVDGHHRYKIALKHPEIPFTVSEKNFACRDSAILWILRRQRGRRNLSEEDKRYLVGKQYETEKRLETFFGNQHTLKMESGVGRSDPHQKNHGTRTRVAKENNVSESYVKRASQYSKGIDAAEKVDPGIKEKIVSGNIDATIEEISALRKLPEEERKIAVEILKAPNEMRKKGSDNQSANQKIKTAEAAKKGDEESHQEDEGPFEESLIVTYDGIVNTFITSSNNLLVRFPKLKSDPKYRKRILEELQKSKKYIAEAERYLNNEY